MKSKIILTAIFSIFILTATTQNSFAARGAKNCDVKPRLHNFYENDNGSTTCHIEVMEYAINGNQSLDMLVYGYFHGFNSAEDCIKRSVNAALKKPQCNGVVDY